MLTQKLKSKRGQAIFEIIPATVVFAMVIFSALIYYRILREQQIRMEVVRNLAFAKINNSGPLTTVPSDWGSSLRLGTPNSFEFTAIQGAQNTPVDRASRCFRVMAEPNNETKSAKTPWLKFGGPGAPAVLPVGITAWAVVYRRPGGTCY